MKRNIQFNEHGENKKQKRQERGVYNIFNILLYLLLCLKKKRLKLDKLMLIGILEQLQEGHKLQIIQNCSYNTIIEGFKLFINPSKCLQIAAIKKNGSIIKHIKNPSEELQLICVSRYPYNIKFIENPTIKIQLIAVDNFGFESYHAFLGIKTPTDDVTIMALKNNPALMLENKMKNISEQIKISVIKKNPFSIHFIKNPSEKIQLTAVKLQSGTIMYIKNPSEKVQLKAVNKHPGSIFYIKNPSEIVKSVSNLNCKYLYKYNH